ncbi:ANTAR domain-containing protein [Streptomyces sp. NPDC001156]
MAFFARFTRRPQHSLQAPGLAGECERMRTEVEQLRHAVTSHALVDQAIGVVVVLGKISPEEAWRVLRDVSQRTNTKLRLVAEHLLAFAQGGELPQEERDELRRALDRYRISSGTER